MVGIATDASKAFAEQLSEIGETVFRPASSPALRLTTPNWERLDPPWWLVRAAVHACVGVTDCGVGTYCILERLDGRSYVQTAFAPEAGVAWRIEWRIAESNGSYTHYFAVVSGDDGSLVHEIEPVVTAFEAFYRGAGLPSGLKWTIYDI